MSVFKPHKHMKLKIFFNEAFDPSVPMAISSILNYVVSVHITYSYRSRRIKGLDIKMTFVQIKMKTILKKNKDIHAWIIKKNKKNILQKNNKRQ